MLAGRVNHFNWSFGNVVANSTNPGTNITPGASNAEGSWTAMASSTDITDDVYGIWIWVSGGGASATSKMLLLDIGVDQAGGTSYTAVVNNLPCGSTNAPVGIGNLYWVPIWIKAGSSMAMRGQGNAATAGTVHIAFVLYGRPTRPETLPLGQYSETIGSVSSSNGTSFTPGNSGAKGSWTTLGTTTRNLWWFTLGVQADDSTTSAQVLLIDLAYGDGVSGSRHTIVENLPYFVPGTTEAVACALPPLGACEVPAGSTIYIRAASSLATQDTGWNALAVGIGG